MQLNEKIAILEWAEKIYLAVVSSPHNNKSYSACLEQAIKVNRIADEFYYREDESPTATEEL